MLINLTKIESECQYNEAMSRIEELLQIVSDKTPLDDPNMVELIRISDLVWEYEQIHYNIMNLK